MTLEPLTLDELVERLSKLSESQPELRHRPVVMLVADEGLVVSVSTDCFDKQVGVVATLADGGVEMSSPDISGPLRDRLASGWISSVDGQDLITLLTIIDRSGQRCPHRRLRNRIVEHYRHMMARARRAAGEAVP